MNEQDRKLLVIKASSDPMLQAVLKEKCRQDIYFWFDTLCWTFDPRRDNTTVAFNLYDYQRKLVKHLYHAIEAQHDFGIEKSRDMGVSWVVALLFQYCWTFHKGWNFHIGSRKEDEVDERGNISTIFEKIRFNLNHQPYWLTPSGWDKKENTSHMELVNPDNGNVISGEAACSNFGRGGLS